MKVSSNPNQDNGGVLDRLRARRAERRIGNTSVRDASGQELLDMLSAYGPDSPMMKGEYNPRGREIIMYSDDEDTLKHEQTHAAQYGPLQRLAKRINDGYTANIQSPNMRKAYRKLTSGKDMVDDREFNDAGKYVMSSGEEFEATIGTGVNAAKDSGVDFNKTYDEVLSSLKSMESPTNNTTGLIKFMQNKFSENQKELILKTFR